MEYIINGWPRRKSEVNDGVKFYWNWQTDLLVGERLLFVGKTFISYSKLLENDMIELSHEGHQGREKN